MKFEHADEIPAGSVLSADICVIGSGAAGITLAQQLDRSKLRVLVLEAGGLEQDPATEAECFEIDHLGTPYGNPIATRGRWFGGSTNLWFGRIAMLDPIDLETRPWLKHSGWPISYAELTRWTPRAAEILAVPHFDKLQLANWPTNPTIDTFARAGGANLGVFLWADGLYMGKQHRSALQASPNVRLLLDSTVTELLPNEGSTSIDEVTVRGRNGNRFMVKAGTYVLAAGGLENARLLLASTSRAASGIGNANDLVGRYYMDHPRGEGLARVDLKGLASKQLERLSLLGEKSRSQFGKVQLRLTFPAQMQRDEELLNHSLHAHLISGVHDSPGYAAARRLLARVRRKASDAGTSVRDDLRATLRGTPLLAEYAARKLLDAVRPSELIVIDQMEQEP
ncbi:MAG TPA: NAD(P)-binding protein, partial [Polyangiaceae bacterium]|nr:NAD(P)-binding protein [Polyangiaceae bacterium]